MHVLLVEDDALLADGLSRILAGHGMQVEVLGNGSVADQVLQRSDAAVAVLDIGLPGIDGYEVARRLRKEADTRHIKLIALTGYGLADDQRRVLDAGFDMHMVKPVDINCLLEAIGCCSQAVDAVK